MFLTEVPRSASLHWSMSPQERGRVTDLIQQRPPRQCPREDRVRSVHERDALAAFDATRHHQTRHSAHWNGLVSLAPRVLTHTHFFRQSTRDAVFRVLLRGHISIRSWRVATSLFGWDEALFLAVFGDLGPPTSPTLLRALKTPAVSFESAVATNYVYRQQILVTTTESLETWCSFQDMKNSKSHWSFGCAIKQHSVRFVLELAAFFIINNNRVQGK